MKTLINTILAIFLFTACVGGGCTCARAVDYSSGERFGSIVKVSERGIFWNTREAELMRSGEGIAVMEPWKFSVIDDAVWQQILEAAASGKRTRISYEQHIMLWPWEGDTQYLATAVEVLPN